MKQNFSFIAAVFYYSVYSRQATAYCNQNSASRLTCHDGHVTCFPTFRISSKECDQYVKRSVFYISTVVALNFTAVKDSLH